MSAHENVGSMVGNIVGGIPDHNLFKLASIKDQRRLHLYNITAIIIWHIKALVFELRGVHKGGLGNLEMSLRDKDAYGVCIRIMADRQT